MNFDFSEDQKFLKDQARRFLTDKSPRTVARRVLEEEANYDEVLWRGIAEMGWPGITVPEAHGGLGLGYLELCVIAEELGRALAPVPFSSSIYLAAEALLLAGGEKQKAAWLPKLASAEAIGTLALAEGPQPPAPERLGVTFANGKLTGEKHPVPDGMIADMAIVAARAPDGETALAVADLKDVKREPVKTLDPSRGHARLRFDATPAEPLEGGGGWATLRRLLDRAAVLFAFEQLGGADVCLDMAKAYSMERYAFGRPIGSFQAIKHKLADMYIANELARSNAYYGAWALSADAPELPLAAASARVAASEAYSFAAKENIQTHGGMGFTWEADCHLLYRRSKLLALNIGAPPAWKDRLVSQLERRNVA
ncbi:MAG: acyl-CoA dehydrogenase family protein [Alphaproteobacteria bacterium]